VCVMSLNECKRNEEKEEPPLGLMVKFLTILPPYKKGDCCNLPGWSQKTTTTTTTAREREREAEKCYFSRSRYRRRRRRRCENH